MLNDASRPSGFASAVPECQSECQTSGNKENDLKTTNRLSWDVWQLPPFEKNLKIQSSTSMLVTLQCLKNIEWIFMSTFVNNAMHIVAERSADFHVLRRGSSRSTELHNVFYLLLSTLPSPDLPALKWLRNCCPYFLTDWTRTVFLTGAVDPQSIGNDMASVVPT